MTVSNRSKAFAKALPNFTAYRLAAFAVSVIDALVASEPQNDLLAYDLGILVRLFLQTHGTETGFVNIIS